jgi:hypothetical protein
MGIDIVRLVKGHTVDGFMRPNFVNHRVVDEAQVAICKMRLRERDADIEPIPSLCNNVIRHIPLRPVCGKTLLALEV